MKLKKREITLNEADSMQDVFFMEEYLFNAYVVGGNDSFRKETVNALTALSQMAQKERERSYSLWKKAKARQL